MALGRMQTAAVGRQPVEESSPAQTAARQVERVPLHAAGACKVGGTSCQFAATSESSPQCRNMFLLFPSIFEFEFQCRDDISGIE